MKMSDPWGVVLDVDLRLVPVSPRLVWRGGLPGAPDCCHEHACQTRQFSEAPGRRSCRLRRGGLMETIVERPGALDVHKAQVTACVRTPGPGGTREAHFAEFATTVAGLLTLRDWLAAHRVTQVTMEATGVYWKPVWAILEDEFELMLVNARHVKQVPGRKTDMSDAGWLCQLAEAGLLRASCRPNRSARCATSRAIARRRSKSARARPTGCTRRSRTPASSSTASLATSSASPDARCSTPSLTEPPTLRCWPIWPAAGCAPSCPRSGKRWRAALTACTRSGSGRSSRTSTSSMSRSPI